MVKKIITQNKHIKFIREMADAYGWDCLTAPSMHSFIKQIGGTPKELTTSDKLTVQFAIEKSCLAIAKSKGDKVLIIYTSGINDITTDLKELDEFSITHLDLAHRRYDAIVYLNGKKAWREHTNIINTRDELRNFLK